jgi:hypothetical protein
VLYIHSLDIHSWTFEQIDRYIFLLLKTTQIWLIAICVWGLDTNKYLTLNRCALGKYEWKTEQIKLVLLWAQLTKIYPPLPTSVQHISITKTLLIVPTKNERDPPLFTGKLLIKFQNILRNTTQVIIPHRVKILFSIISSPITLERQKWKSSKMKGSSSLHQ